MTTTGLLLLLPPCAFNSQANMCTRSVGTDSKISRRISREKDIPKGPYLVPGNRKTMRLSRTCDTRWILHHDYPNTHDSSIVAHTIDANGAAAKHSRRV
ncbi:hypothetical protein F4780DRAFT_268136 [Xylariomycetidae sp. FL0641]|nr:hypothetical protein F4780DRAFT_268136 [Xylariomycetidae sp. FL0641]